MQQVQYLTFEINNTCNLTELHPKCPINDSERYSFGDVSQSLKDSSIVEFWLWCRSKGFNGIILWHLYNEPTLVIDRIISLMKKMQKLEPSQRFHLWTNNHQKFEDFNHVQLTNYNKVRPDELDDRRKSAQGEGRGYLVAEPQGYCIRGSLAWELIIDFFGNWLLCCSDWRCENSVGNIFKDSWNELLEKYRLKAHIEWKDKESFGSLPRMCRACITENPGLHKSATMVGYGG